MPQCEIPARDGMNGGSTKTATIDTALDIAKTDIDWYDTITKGFSNDPNGDSANTHLHFLLFCYIERRQA